MEHPGELWQEADYNGARIGDGLIPDACYDKPHKLLMGAAIMLYRFNDGDLEYLFQHRSKQLIGNPDKWDTSAGGHVNINEPTLAAAVRETKEEINADIDPAKLEFFGRYLRGEIIVNLYFYNWTGNEDNFKFNDAEVEEVCWVKVKNLDDFWPNLKPHLADDVVFKYLLDEHIKRVS